MIGIVFTGRVHATPESKVGKSSGRPYAVASFAIPAADGSTVWAKVTAFSDGAMGALLKLSAGDSAAVVGAVTPRAYVNKQGEAALSLDVVAERLLSAYEFKRRREAEARVAPVSPSRSQPAPAEFDDTLPWGDE